MSSSDQTRNKRHKVSFAALKTILVRTFRSWIKNEPLRESAVIAFFAIISIPALMVLLINFLGIFLEEEKVANKLSDVIKHAINPATADQILSSVKNAGQMKEGFLSTTLGIIVIVFAATRVFVHLQKTLDHIWEFKSHHKKRVRSFINTLFSIGLIIVIGILLMISMLVSTFLASAGEYLQTVLPDQVIYLLHLFDFLVTLLVISVLFAVIFKYLPSFYIAWRQVISGAILTAFLFMVLKYGMSFYFARASPGSAYGAAGTVFLIMLWVAVSSMILFFGAEFTKQYSEYFGIEFQKNTRDSQEDNRS